MSELKFNRVNYEKHNNYSIYIMNGDLHLRLKLKEGYRILNVQKTDWGYRKAIIKFDDQDLIKKLKSWETEINDHLENENLKPITIVYGNQVYAKTEILSSIPTKKKEFDLWLKSVWVDKNKNRHYMQIWLE